MDVFPHVVWNQVRLINPGGALSQAARSLDHPKDEKNKANNVRRVDRRMNALPTNNQQTDRKTDQPTDGHSQL